MKRILLDVDGVVADTIPVWLGFYNTDYNDSLTIDDITDWGLHKFVKPECGKKIYDYLYLDNLYDNVKQIQGAREGFELLSANDYDVVFVSSGFQPSKYRWMQRNGFLKAEKWEFDPKLVIAHDKSLIKGEVMIDDGVHNLKAFDGTRVLFDQPWNREAYRTPYFYVRALSWEHIVEMLCK